jgi:glucose-6-phosphate 1-dehydrogenase
MQSFAWPKKSYVGALVGLAMNAIAAARPQQALVLFGATGDLAQRMIWPSLYHLEGDGLLPTDLSVVGTAREPFDAQSFREFVASALQRFLDSGEFNPAICTRLLDRVSYFWSEVRPDDTLDAAALATGLCGYRSMLYFLSMPPRYYGAVCRCRPRRCQQPRSARKANWP